jgi:hypothetical protein
MTETIFLTLSKPDFARLVSGRSVAFSAQRLDLLIEIRMRDIGPREMIAGVLEYVDAVLEIREVEREVEEAKRAQAKPRDPPQWP